MLWLAYAQVQILVTAHNPALVAVGSEIAQAQPDGLAGAAAGAVGSVQQAAAAAEPIQAEQGQRLLIQFFTRGHISAAGITITQVTAGMGVGGLEQPEGTGNALTESGQWEQRRCIGMVCKMLLKGVAVEFDKTKAGQVVGFHLAINQFNTLTEQQRCNPGKGKL